MSLQFETSIVTIQKFPWGFHICKVAQPLNLKGNFKEEGGEPVWRGTSCTCGKHWPCPSYYDCYNQKNQPWPSAWRTDVFQDPPPAYPGQQLRQDAALNLSLELDDPLLLGAVLLLIKILAPIVLVPQDPEPALHPIALHKITFCATTFNFLTFGFILQFQPVRQKCGEWGQGLWKRRRTFWRKSWISMSRIHFS